MAFIQNCVTITAWGFQCILHLFICELTVSLKKLCVTCTSMYSTCSLCILDTLDQDVSFLTVVRVCVMCTVNLYYSVLFIFKVWLETKAKGSTLYRNPRGSHIEHERVARGFYGDARVSIPRRSRWPRSLTGLEYSNRCYPTKEFRLHAFFCAAGGHYLCIGKHGDFSSSASLNGLPRPTTPC